MNGIFLAMLTLYMVLFAPSRIKRLFRSEAGCRGTVMGIIVTLCNPVALLFVLTAKVADPWWPAAVALVIAILGVLWKWAAMSYLLEVGIQSVKEARGGIATIEHKGSLYKGMAVSRRMVGELSYVEIKPEQVRNQEGEYIALLKEQRISLLQTEDGLLKETIEDREHNPVKEASKLAEKLSKKTRFFFEIPTFYLVWVTAFAWFQLLGS